jgi:hypothetical protein
MTISVQKRQSQAREIFRINPVAVGCTLLMLASGAYAQQTAATLETVTCLNRIFDQPACGGGDAQPSRHGA